MVNLVSNTQDTTSNNNTINDPLHRASSDHPGMVLTNTPFNGDNFLGWSRNVKMAFSAKLKLGFIDGSCPKPAITDENVQRWVICDYMVTCWILNSMVTELSKAFLIGYFDWYKGKKQRKVLELHLMLVAVVCSEMMKMFKGKGIAEENNCSQMNTRLDWVTDTGASYNMTSHFSLFVSIRYLSDPIMVHFPDGRSLKVTIVGEVALTPSLILSDVFYVLEFQLNLLSVGK
uniref:Uncharacterized protein n=1 Tax=Tanacetum cinerariifolium TaxID=118510 RepID=A0A6L2JW09_TANCI|nr:hypothetical protein CTI12_AA427390 [Tanacetum cinerariifolium]